MAILLIAFLLAVAGPASAAIKATNLAVAGDSKRTTISMALDQDPDLRWFQLRAPYRLVIELPETAFAFDPKALRSVGLVSTIRYGKAAEGRSRLILSSAKPFSIEKVDVQAGDKTGHELTITLSSSTDEAFRAAMTDQASSTGSVAAEKEPVAAQEKRFTIVVDAGHGGFDGGAEGPSGTIEKDITLAFAKELRDRLSEAKIYDVLMTRETDKFLRLDERVQVAQAHQADLFVSIHADTIRYKGLRGATVYTGSDRASDAEAEALADRENLSDQLPGVPEEGENHEVADILFEFVRRETQDYSARVARNLVQELSTSVGVINNPHRHARFKVLRAPDVPSVLIELGYLSNLEDEKSLRDPQWRAKAVDSIAAAVEKFAALKTAVAEQTPN